MTNTLVYIGTHPFALPIICLLVGIFIEVSRRNKRTGGDS